MIAADRPVQRPPTAKLLIVDAWGRISHRPRAALLEFLHPGDLVVADEAATIGYPEVRRGLVAAIVVHDLVRQLGDRRARELLLTGEPIDATPAGRWGTLEDMAGVAVFLASAASDFVTGTAIPVDGGYSVLG